MPVMIAGSRRLPASGLPAPRFPREVCQVDIVIYIAAAVVVLGLGVWGLKLFQYVRTGEWQIDERLRSL